jgi:hypothetical protein
MRGRITALLMLAFPFVLWLVFCPGIGRPPRPMFHDSYGAGGFEVVPYWIPNTPLVDDHGHWLWVDEGDNLMVVQATETAERGRSHAMIGGRTQSQFRLGSAWDDERDNQHATIPRMRDTLVVILPDGRWLASPLATGQAARFFRNGLQEQPPDLLQAAGSLLHGEAISRFQEFLKGYVRPEPEGEKGKKGP